MRLRGPTFPYANERDLKIPLKDTERIGTRCVVQNDNGRLIGRLLKNVQVWLGLTRFVKV